jgi:hypothetical protein
MKQLASRKTNLLTVLTGGAIPTVLIRNKYFRLPDKFTVVLVVFLSFIFGSMALLAYANRHADGSEWWQHDSTSGWRGY